MSTKEPATAFKVPGRAKEMKFNTRLNNGNLKRFTWGFNAFTVQQRSLNQDGFWTNYPKAGLHCGVVGDLWLVLIRDIFLYWNFTTYNSNDYWVFLNYLQFLDTRLLLYKEVVFQSNCFRHPYLPFNSDQDIKSMLENNSLSVLAPFWSLPDSDMFPLLKRFSPRAWFPKVPYPQLSISSAELLSHHTSLPSWFFWH